MQDRAIKDIGELALIKNKNLKPYELFTQNPYPKGQFKMLLIQFSQKENNIEFRGVDLRNVNEKNYTLYAYRKGSSRGGDVTFTTKANKEFKKKLNTLLNIQFPKLINQSIELGSVNLQLFINWRESFAKNLDIIIQELEVTYGGLNKKEQMTSSFSVSINISEQEFLPGHFPEIQKLIEKDGTEGNYEKYGVISKGCQVECSICHQVKDEVFGFGSPFKYSTVDKTGFVSNFFEQKNNWINYPICEDCAIKMELGKNYITNNLTKYFFGKSYYLIPKTVFSNDKVPLEKALLLFKDLEYKIKNSETISSTEDYLMEQIGLIEKNIFTLNLLFFEENPTTKAMKIKLNLEEIPPSRFRKLFIEIPQIINKNPLFKDIDYHFQKKQNQDLRFSFSLIKKFFEDNFYEITYKIFMGKKINQNELNKRFIDVIRENYRKRINGGGYERGDLLIAKTFMVQLYFEKLNLINNS